MNMENKQPISIDQVAAVDKTRRKLTKAGIASPIILSLASKPVWATTCTFSGMMSGNASNPGFEEQCPLPGLSMEYWLRNPDSWPAPFEPDTKFDMFFKNQSAISPSDPNYTGELYGNSQNGRFAVILECAVTKRPLKAAKEVDCKGENGQGAPQYSRLLEDDLRDCAGACIAATLNSTAGLPGYPHSVDDIIALFQECYRLDSRGCKDFSKIPSALSHLADDFNGLNNRHD